jgi:hypothetical protein
MASRFTIQNKQGSDYGEWPGRTPAEAYAHFINSKAGLPKPVYVNSDGDDVVFGEERARAAWGGVTNWIIRPEPR